MVCECGETLARAVGWLIAHRHGHPPKQKLNNRRAFRFEELAGEHSSYWIIAGSVSHSRCLMPCWSRVSLANIIKLFSTKICETKQNLDACARILPVCYPNVNLVRATYVRYQFEGILRNAERTGLQLWRFVVFCTIQGNEVLRDVSFHVIPVMLAFMLYRGC
jgi:hypothetical protein